MVVFFLEKQESNVLKWQLVNVTYADHKFGTYSTVYALHIPLSLSLSS